MDNPDTVYLDQNQWIYLAKAQQDKSGENYNTFKKIQSRISDASLIIPLSMTNIYETQKINNQIRRLKLGNLQAELSMGWVFLHIPDRLALEAQSAIDGFFCINSEKKDPRWWMKQNLFEALMPDEITSYPNAAKAAAINPTAMLRYYLHFHDEKIRQNAIRKYSNGLKEFALTKEKQKTKISQETMEMRRRIYSANLLIDNIHLYQNALLRRDMLPSRLFSDDGELARSLIENTPTLYCEREIAIRLEKQAGRLTENDARDLQSFYTSSPYADIIVAENKFVNLARQANIHKKYGCKLLTKLSELSEILSY